MSAVPEVRRPPGGEVPPGWPEALRTAHLLTADHGCAEELAVAALLRARQGRPLARLRPPATTPAGSVDFRTLVPALAASPLRRRRPGGPPGGAGLRRRVPAAAAAYRRLPPRARGLLVLLVAEGLDARAAATALRLPPGRAAGETVAALDALRGPLAADTGSAGEEPARAPGVAGGPALELDLRDPASGASARQAVDDADPVVRRLRALFEELAGDPPRTPDPAGRVERAAARDRRLRRRVLAATAALAVVLGVGGTLAARVYARAEAEQARAERERTLQALLHPVVRGGDVSTWPTRGSHAGDAALLAQVRRRAGAGGSLPFVGRVGDLDVALVVGGAGDQPRLRVLHGPAGSPPGGWDEDDGVPGADADTPSLSAAVRDGAGVVHLVVVTLSSGVSAAYSTAPVLADDGTAGRRYVALDLDDGVGTALTSGEPRRFAVRLESAAAVQIGGLDVTAPAFTPAAPFPTAMPGPLQTAPSCDGSSIAGDTSALADQALDKAGLTAGDVIGIRQLWCHRGGNRTQLLIALFARRGPDVQCYEEATTRGGTTGFNQLCWPVARGSGARAGFVAPRIGDVEPTDPPGLTVWAPGAARLEVLTSFDPVKPVLTLPVGPDGYARIVLPGGQGPAVDHDDDTVVEMDARGHEIGRLTARGPASEDAWGEYADGRVQTAAEGSV